MENKKIKIADFVIEVQGDNFCNFISEVGAFAPFFTDSDAGFKVIEDLGVASAPDLLRFFAMPSLYDIEFEGIACRFGESAQGQWFTMKDAAAGGILVLKWKHGETVVHSTSDLCRPMLTRFALWMAVNALLLPRRCAAIHSSVNVCEGEAVMCLGESGTGKSTHTRLLREVYSSIFLLNDDSPFVRAFEDGRIMVYGSPWSGKTPCYRQEVYPLKAVLRLSQAPHNKIFPLSPLMAIGALQPSMPPAFNYSDTTSDSVCDLVSDIVSAVSCYHLECLPDHEAARLSHDTVFGPADINH